MPDSQKKSWDKSIPLNPDIQETPQSTMAAQTATSFHQGALLAEAKVSAFRYRVLIVDDELAICEIATAIFEKEGYEVLSAGDGLEALRALDKSLPDVIISDLNMPRMSGFEFLTVVRKRFPHIATIAMSGHYITGESPNGVLADAFFQKGYSTLGQLFQEVVKLLAASPLRSEREKSDNAPLFVRRDQAGYLIITCPKCLRPNKLEAMNLNGGIHQTMCRSCGTPVKFEINHEIEPLLKGEQG